jgi:4-carboxymuconolactone decarboxylase
VNAGDRRLRRLRPDDLDGEQRALYDTIASGPRARGAQHFALTDEGGALRGPFNALLLSPSLGTALQEIGSAVRYRTGLTDRVREMAILLVAAHWDSAFESTAHTAVGRAVGLTEAEIASLHQGAPPDLAGADEARALSVVQRLLDDADLDDATYADAALHLGETAVFELTVLVGYYASLALQLRVFRADG